MFPSDFRLPIFFEVAMLSIFDDIFWRWSSSILSSFSICLKFIMQEEDNSNYSIKPDTRLEERV